jgi:hypothetical protein
VGKYTGAWAQRAATPTPAVPLKPGPDPEHLTPTDNIDVAAGNPLWVASAPAPDLPTALTAEPFGTPIGGGGPIDMTPDDPNFGVGSGPGLTTLESQDIRGFLMSDDRGAVAARHYQASIDRDGAPHVAIIPDVPLDGDSPQTNELQRSGVGQPNDPFARTGRRIKRWYDRYIDMHRYPVEQRPMYVVNASGSREQPAVPGGTQYDSPWATPGPYRATPDSFVSPQVRRTPQPWDVPMTGDGTAMQLAGDPGAFGLGSWGL